MTNLLFLSNFNNKFYFEEKYKLENIFNFLKLEMWENLVKGIWWMPRHQKTMKDVAACDKLRGGGKQPLIR